jgi:hypothetical protein
MYEYISGIEIEIHRIVQQTLKAEWGDQEKEWWGQGVPVEIRKKCETRRQDDAQPCDSEFAYTDLIDLGKIILENWGLFKNHLPQNYGINRNVIDADFVRLNTIRNAVMHSMTKQDWSEDDFQFVKDVRGWFLRDRTPQQPAGGNAKDCASRS